LTKGKILAAWALVLISCNAGPAAAATLNVPSDFTTIAGALTSAGPGDVIKVAPGRYQEYGLVLPGGVTLDGSHDPANPTIIDGADQGRILTVGFLERPSIIQNLTFENGWAKTDEGYQDCGGAIYINDSSILIRNCRFLGNRAEFSGGAISCMMASPSIISCHFQNNWAARGGGALDCSYDASPQVVSSTFIYNSSAFGGALACRGDSRPQVSSCHFDSNTTEGDRAHGGAVLSFFWGAPEFINCTFSRNTADLGGALFADANSPTDLTSCTIVANTATDQGGGIYALNSNLEIRTSIIAHQDGSGVTTEGSIVPLVSCTDIFGNSGGDWVGGIARQAEARGNLELDPLFCESDPDVDYQFRLQEDSPCAEENGACANLGAWEVGCSDQVGIEEAGDTFGAEWVNGTVHFGWESRSDLGSSHYRVTRSSLESPQSEVEIPYSVEPVGHYVGQDTELVPRENIHYEYRLYLISEAGEKFLLAEVVLDPPPRVLTIGKVGAWPNPFNPQTTIHFELGATQKIKVDIYGIDGRRVRTLAHQTLPPGPQDLLWNGRDNNGRIMASGPYVVIVSGEVDNHRLKVTLLK
jgi:predicted outer membrane repeat protein